MSEHRNYGRLTPDMVGVGMREVARRAIEEIREQRFIFEAQGKQGYDGEMNDLVTTADLAAQQIYVRLLMECFPGYGIISEEEGLRVESKLPGNPYFTIDPLDGTKAFARKQSSGCGTMLALVIDGEVVAVVIGDIMTKEIYYTRPESDKVHRISDLRVTEQLKIDRARLIKDQHCLIRGQVVDLSPGAQRFLKYGTQESPFAGLSSDNGSIGLSMARLWKGEVGAVILSGSHRTPWDEAPLIGICKKLGFVCLKIDPETGTLSYFDWDPPTEVVPMDGELLIVHRSAFERGEIVL